LYKTAEGEKKPLYTVDGQWSDKFNIKDARSKDVIDSWSAKDNQTTPLTLAPLEEQDLYESRRAWSDVATNIQKGDMDAVSGYKSRIENAQRELRRVEKEECREWERRFFNRIESDDAQIQPTSLSRLTRLVVFGALMVRRLRVLGRLTSRLAARA
jgi:hypothetical protein